MTQQTLEVLGGIFWILWGLQIIQYYYYYKLVIKTILWQI